MDLQYMITDPSSTQTLITLASLTRRFANGDESVLPELTPALYAELRRIAQSHLRKEAAGHTLQATAVVHEAYARLHESGDSRVQSEIHFMRLASRVMRHVLVDHARAKRAIKRGGEVDVTSLDRTEQAFHTRCADALFSNASGEETSLQHEMDFLALDSALEQLHALSPRQAEVVDLRFFSDLSIEQTAAALGVSVVTIKRDWSVARLFLQQAMGSFHGEH
jgi:RNA polymerase sigma factor (TIGR02999 family)